MSNYAPEQILYAAGWRITDVTTRDAQNHIVQITWWRKAGREFPQHFALWLERSGAVRLLSAK